jgi:hypothetical protein
MTLQSIGAFGIAWPGLASTGNAVALNNRTTLDASGEYHAVIMMAKENMVVSHVGAYTGAATGSPTVDIRIETVDVTTGFPSGTLWATDTNIVTGTLTSGTWAVHALTASATINTGQIFALKIAYNSGTSVILSEASNINGLASNYSVINTGTPAAGMFSNMPWGLGSSSTAFYKMQSILPVNGISSANLNNTGGARRGLKFSLPFACRAIGARMAMPASVAGDFNIGIWDDAGAEVGSSITAYDRSGWPTGSNGSVTLLFDSPVTLAASTNYRLAIEPTSATNTTVYHVTVASADIRSGLPGGTDCLLTTYTTGGGWVDTADTTVPLIDLIIDQLDDGAGSGGARQKVYGG